MDEAKEKTLDLKASGVEACRICLAADVKLYSIRDTHLGLCMESIGGFTKSYKGLPNYVCYECAPILIKCNKLIEKSRTAQATLLDIFNKNGQINGPLIKEQTKTELNLQSSFNSYLLLNYYYIKYDDDSSTSNFINTESDPNEKININLKTEMKKESSNEVSELEIQKMFEDFSTAEESDKDSEAETREVDVPLVEIVSDDEKIGDDFISLKSYEVKMDNRVKVLRAQNYDIPHYYTSNNIRPIGLEKNKKKKMIRREPSSACSNDYMRRYFHIQGTVGFSSKCVSCNLY